MGSTDKTLKWLSPMLTQYTLEQMNLFLIYFELVLDQPYTNDGSNLEHGYKLRLLKKDCDLQITCKQNGSL